MRCPLIRKKPAKVVSRPDGAGRSNPAYFRPEGHLYVAFCLNVRGLVLEMDIHDHQHPSEELNEIRTWWSFKENVAEDSPFTIAFLDLLAGDEPEWETPEFLRSGRVSQIAHHFYRREAVKDAD
jgi:hypothetical protein